MNLTKDSTKPYPMALHNQEIETEYTIYNQNILVCGLLKTASCFVTPKEPKVIVNGIFRSWMQIYEMPEKLLSDNWGELANSTFIDMYQSMNIAFKLTAAKAPFSNA